MTDQIASLEAAYELGAVLGEGGFGVVFEAQPRGGGDPVAVKLDRGAPNPEALRRIRREVRLARQLQHPGLVRFLGLYRSRDQRLALVYEKVEGVPLSRRLGAPLPLDEVVALARPLAGALDALHDAGLVHRDLKPENVLVEPSGRPRLLDFGLLRGTASGATLTATGVILGTPVVMAPELFHGDAATPASDRYSFACVLYRMLTGRYPLEGDAGDLMRALLRDRGAARAAAQQGAEAGRRVAGAGGLDPDPARRPRSAAALVEAVARAVGESPQHQGTVVLAARTPGGEGEVSTPQRVEGVGLGGPRERTGALTPRGALAGPRGAGWRPGRGSLGWAMAGLAAMAVGFGLSGVGRVRPGAGGSSPVEPGRGPRPAGPARLVEQLDQLTEARLPSRDGRTHGPRVFARDPREWHRLLPHLPPVRRVLLDWMAGEDPTRLGEAEQAELREADAFLQRRGLPEVFSPALDVRPEGAPARTDPGSRMLQKFRAAVSGDAWSGTSWANAALRHLLEAEAFTVDRHRRLEHGEADGLQRWARTPMTVLGAWDLVDAMDRIQNRSPEARLQLYGWLEPGLRAVRRYLVAVMKMAGQPGAAEDPRVPVFFGSSAKTVRPLIYGAVALPGMPAGLGVAPRTPLQKLFAARFSHELRKRLGFHRASFHQLRDLVRQEADWFRSAAAAAGPGSGGDWIRTEARVLLPRLLRDLEFYRQEDERRQGPAASP